MPRSRSQRDAAAVLAAAALCPATALRVPLHPYRRAPGPGARGGSSRGGAAERAQDPGVSDGIVYCVDVWLGSPAQHQRVQLDTGSGDLAVASTLCHECTVGELELYDPTVSGNAVMCDDPICRETARAECPPPSNACEYRNMYVDRSGFTARVFTDVIAFDLDRPSSAKAVVSAFVEEHPGTGQTSFEPYLCNGIMGVGYRRIATTFQDNAIFKYAQQTGQPNLFSICVAPSGSGLMGVGEVLNSSTGETWYEPVVRDMQFPDQGDRGFWAVRLQDISVAGASIRQPASVYNSGPCIVDTGTTNLVLPPDAYNALIDAINRNVPAGVPRALFNGGCTYLTPEQVDAFPRVSFVFTKLTLTITGDDYLDPGLCVSAGLYALSVSEMSEPGTILGLPVMRGFVTIFDGEKLRVGWTVVAGCPTDKSVRPRDWNGRLLPYYPPLPVGYDAVGPIPDGWVPPKLTRPLWHYGIAFALVALAYGASRSDVLRDCRGREGWRTHAKEKAGAGAEAPQRQEGEYNRRVEQERALADAGRAADRDAEAPGEEARLLKPNEHVFYDPQGDSPGSGQGGRLSPSPERSAGSPAAAAAAAASARAAAEAAAVAAAAASARIAAEAAAAAALDAAAAAAARTAEAAATAVATAAAAAVAPAAASAEIAALAAAAIAPAAQPAGSDSSGPRASPTLTPGPEPGGGAHGADSPRGSPPRASGAERDRAGSERAAGSDRAAGAAGPAGSPHPASGGAARQSHGGASRAAPERPSSRGRPASASSQGAASAAGASSTSRATTARSAPSAAAGASRGAGGAAQRQPKRKVGANQAEPPKKAKGKK
eukprot:TRINITY_DN55262_c0_g1_i1.p1 TRINITY_DN55262_c0_g1~~TRINITY_DN55262_c0_g1_i1.p1  ORF type:complete len:829 (+),score=126.87 TRINITY_DN55262_c0_g1_i1:93-2579(+)